MDILKSLPTKTVLAIFAGSFLIWAVMDYLCDNERFGMGPEDFGKCRLIIPLWAVGCILSAIIIKKREETKSENSG